MAEALSEPPTTAAPIAEPPAEEAAAPTGIFGRKADPAKPPPPAHRPPPPAPAPAHVSSSNGGGFSAAAAARATPKKQQPPEEKASLLPSSEPRSDANGNAAAGRRTSPSPPRSRQYTDSDLLGIELVGRENGTPLPITSPGFGPASMKTAILLQVTYRGALLRPSLTVRCPSKRSDLYEKLASVFSLVPGSIKVVYQSMPKIWCELGTINELFEALRGSRIYEHCLYRYLVRSYYIYPSSISSPRSYRSPISSHSASSPILSSTSNRTLCHTLPYSSCLRY